MGNTLELQCVFIDYMTGEKCKLKRMSERSSLSKREDRDIVCLDTRGMQLLCPDHYLMMLSSKAIGIFFKLDKFSAEMWPVIVDSFLEECAKGQKILAWWTERKGQRYAFFTLLKTTFGQETFKKNQAIACARVIPWCTTNRNRREFTRDPEMFLTKRVSGALAMLKMTGKIEQVKDGWRCK